MPPERGIRYASYRQVYHSRDHHHGRDSSRNKQSSRLELPFLDGYA
ncbi:MAG: hypothetical protein IJS29_05895 [Selenomonadaceae bacterium]|nr:hypothetical protein [Selenomonadaceae bacterium]